MQNYMIAAAHDWGGDVGMLSPTFPGRERDSPTILLKSM